jgi:hypothetical protein
MVQLTFHDLARLEWRFVASRNLTLTPNGRLQLLPAELRVLIFEHLLVNEHSALQLYFNTKECFFDIGQCYDGSNDLWTELSIIATCRQLREEGLRILLSRNDLAFTGPPPCYDKFPCKFRIAFPMAYLRFAKRIFVSYYRESPYRPIHSRLALLLLVQHLIDHSAQLDIFFLCCVFDRIGDEDCPAYSGQIEDLAPFALQLLERNRVKQVYLCAQAFYDVQWYAEEHEVGDWPSMQRTKEIGLQWLIHHPALSESVHRGLTLAEHWRQKPRHVDSPLVLKLTPICAPVRFEWSRSLLLQLRAAGYDTAPAALDTFKVMLRVEERPSTLLDIETHVIDISPWRWTFRCRDYICNRGYPPRHCLNKRYGEARWILRHRCWQREHPLHDYRDPSFYDELGDKDECELRLDIKELMTLREVVASRVLWLEGNKEGQARIDFKPRTIMELSSASQDL